MPIVNLVVLWLGYRDARARHQHELRRIDLPGLMLGRSYLLPRQEAQRYEQVARRWADLHRARAGRAGRGARSDDSAQSTIFFAVLHEPFCQ